MKRKGKKDGGPLAPNPDDEKVFDAGTGEPERLEPDEPAAAPATPTNFQAEPEPEPAHAPQPEPERRERRGRPAGGKNKKRSSGTRDEEAPENISKLLLSLHQMLAGFLDVPELLLSKEEAESMGEAIAEVEALYADVSFVSPEVRAWGRLITVSVMTYWPRYKVIKMRMDKEAAAQRDIDVTPINRGAQPGAATASTEVQ